MSEQDEIYGVKTINWEDSSWEYFSLIGDEQVISLQRTKVYVFSDSVLCLGKIHENCMGTKIGLVQHNTSQEYRDLDRIDGEPMEFEWLSHSLFARRFGAGTNGHFSVLFQRKRDVFYQ